MKAYKDMWAVTTSQGIKELYLDGHLVNLIKNNPSGYITCSSCNNRFYAQYFWGYYTLKSPGVKLINEDRFCGKCVSKLHFLAELRAR